MKKSIQENKMSSISLTSPEWHMQEMSTNVSAHCSLQGTKSSSPTHAEYPRLHEGRTIADVLVNQTPLGYEPQAPEVQKKDN